MVSLWPWKSDNASPESFEKTLSALSGKLAAASTTLEGRRQSARRFKALWTLYTSIAYLLYVMIVALVIGWKNWNTVEYTALAASPLIIYVGRTSVSTYYDYRISRQQTYVSSLQKQRDETIKKLKAATKYDSTQQLLEKYGGTPAKPKQKGLDGRKPQPGTQKPQQQHQRTGLGPPPTANIPGRQGTAPGSPLRPDQSSAPNTPTPINTSKIPANRQEGSPQLDSAEFAPNAFPGHYYAQPEGPKWYDRFMDILLGEDESNPKNRLALICKKCRLVNGQAPPGTRTLEDVGKWRCSGCGTMNGEISEAKKLMAEIQEEARANKARGVPSAQLPSAVQEEEDVDLVEDGHRSDSSDVTVYTDDEYDIAEVAESSMEQKEERMETPPKPKRGRPKGSTKKKM